MNQLNQLDEKFINLPIQKTQSESLMILKAITFLSVSQIYFVYLIQVYQVCLLDVHILDLFCLLNVDLPDFSIFKVSKGVIRIKKQTRQWLIEIGQVMIYKILHRKLKIEQRVPHQKPEEISGASEVPVPLVAPVVFLLLQFFERRICTLQFRIQSNKKLFKCK